jgi:hypothetical protein
MLNLYFIIFNIIKIKIKNIFYKKNTIKIKNDDYVANIFEKVFINNSIVFNGPFQGMKYVNKSFGSDYLSKLIGSYEEHLQDWVYEIINNKKYNNIFNIGCAEGYYACGFALKLPNSKIFAYDINNLALELLSENIRLNNIKNVFYDNLFTKDTLSVNLSKGDLLFIDIEGGENDLLDIKKCPILKSVDIIVESHDCFVPNLTEKLINRFCFTHKIKIIVDYNFRIKKYFTPGPLSLNDFEIITNENRSNFMKFIYFESIEK